MSKQTPDGLLVEVGVYREDTADEITRKMMAVFNALHPDDAVDAVDGEIVRRDGEGKE